MEFTALLDPSLELNLNTMPSPTLDESPPPIPSGFSSNRGICSQSWDSIADERGVLKDKLKKLSEENKKLTQLLNATQENYNKLSCQLREQAISNSSDRKRKAETSTITKEELAFCGESSSNDRGFSKKPRELELRPTISRVFVKTDPSDISLIVKDEYKWRKYGQKVTKDNPCPKAYYKCGSSPNCPVKKKVQRSIEDQSIVVATYEGEHIHPLPAASKGDTGASTLSSFEPTHKVGDEESAGFNATPEVQKLFIEKMASTLAKDAIFRDALAAAISERFQVQSNHK